MRIVKQLLLFGAVAHLTGCAAIFIPKSQKVTIKTDNPKSKVYIDNEEVGVGDDIVTKVKKTVPNK